MLQVEYSRGPLAKMSVFNRVDWLDIGHADLGPIANSLQGPAVYGWPRGRASGAINAYPRWSSRNLWGLGGTRCSFGLGTRPDHRSETIPTLPEA